MNNNSYDTEVATLASDASGVVKQSSEESRELNLFCLVILEEQ
jgi:hypothetical protein